MVATQTFSIFTPAWGNDPIRLIFFKRVGNHQLGLFVNLFLLNFVFVGACFSLSHQLKKNVFSRNFSSRSSRLKSNHVGSHPLRESHDQDGITFFSDRDAIPKKPSESKLGEKLDGTRLIAVTIDSIDHSKFAISQHELENVRSIY